MITKTSKELLTKFKQAQNRKFCPQCGCQMTAVDRRNENGALFVWYKCSRNNCQGQWLQKIPR